MDPETLPCVSLEAWCKKAQFLSHKFGCREQMLPVQAWPGMSVTAANLIVYTEDHIATPVATDMAEGNDTKPA